MRSEREGERERERDSEREGERGRERDLEAHAGPDSLDLALDDRILFSRVGFRRLTEVVLGGGGGSFL